MSGSIRWNGDDLTDRSQAGVARSRVAYVTQFSHRFCAGCVLKVGDQEVMALDVDGETRQVHPVSSNRAALGDTPQEPPCQL